MQAQQETPGALTVQAPAKLNLFLEVLGKRPDGYHEIATLMLAIGLYDQLEIEEDGSGQLTLTCDQPQLSCGEDNLVMKAARLLKERSGTARGARMHLTKRIPMAAGLAGGSSDAAAALGGLDRLWALGQSTGQLAELAAQLGSDVPFFLSGPAAWCTGRGEQITPVKPGTALWFVLVCPAAGLGTADVYRRVKVPDSPLDGAELQRVFAAGDIEEIGRRLHNRLQAPAEELCPEVSRARDMLGQLGPAGVLMSGSGSTVFALCRSRPDAERVALGLRHGSEAGARPRVFLVQGCS
ncbi:MAG: 4-(cytidine 5'-diphospho)-2-C-methyl-D-erythritol kinase [Gemmataceae bacterium]